MKETEERLTKLAKLFTCDPEDILSVAVEHIEQNAEVFKQSVAVKKAIRELGRQSP